MDIAIQLVISEGFVEMKFFSDLAHGVIAAILMFVALGTFLWGLFELIRAETQSPYAAMRIDPTIAIGWLLVSLIIGLLAAKVSGDDRRK